MITLTSSDDIEFKLLVRDVNISTVVNASLETDPGCTAVPVPGVEGIFLEQVVKYMKRHKGIRAPIIDKPLKSKVMSDVVADRWDATFIDGLDSKTDDGNHEQLYGVILAANYMDIQCLLHLGCAKVASLIKGQPIDKIKSILGDGADTKA